MKNLSILILLAALFAACSNSTSSDSDEFEEEWLLSVQQATDQYNDIEAALDDGFVDPGMGCVENPEGPGAFGIPHVHPDRLSDDAIDPANPEVLFYEPQQDGSLRLVGTENALPIELWDGEQPPALFGHEFHRNEEEGLFGIHIWVWKENPEGIFAFWHTDVSCQYYTE